MKQQDIRWIQRFQNYQKALRQLNRAIQLAETRALTELEEQGLIQAFEYTHELAWKTLKDFLEDKGNSEIYGSKDATREAFSYGLISKADVWMSMIKSRNNTSHTYNEDVAGEISEEIKRNFIALFNELEEKLEQLSKSHL
jgi:nucleotidyltransferase substrate binding protein (TIGR01987 family)